MRGKNNLYLCLRKHCRLKTGRSDSSLPHSRVITDVPRVVGPIFKILCQIIDLPPLKFAVGGVLPMPYARRGGTAWDRRREDYAYTRDIDGPGWAWEFLRQNEDYRWDFRMKRAGHPVAIDHISGATLYRPSRRFFAAEAWGLVLFANPEASALNTHVFWLPHVTRHTVRCNCSYPADKCAEVLSIDSFNCCRSILSGFTHEHIKLTSQNASVNLINNTGTLLFGESTIVFFHCGIGSASKHSETMNILKKFSDSSEKTIRVPLENESKYLIYLIALHGHQEGRSYRDIAEVVYGKERVRAHWTADTRWMKSKVRRAVRCGLELMNGGYRELL
jgi:hypothetical protein